jgi:hypothetical protein
MSWFFERLKISTFAFVSLRRRVFFLRGLYYMSKVSYYEVLTTKPLEDRKFKLASIVLSFG